MIELRFCKAQRTEETLFELLQSKIGAKPVILRMPNGKPYLEGNPVYFSVTHSGDRAAIAFYEKPVGVDMELYKQKAHLPIASRFCDEEREEILSEKDFLIHWTVREAFVKYRGATLAEYLKSMAYYGGNLYFDGKIQPVELITHDIGGGVVTICIGKGENL